MDEDKAIYVAGGSTFEVTTTSSVIVSPLKIKNETKHCTVYVGMEDGVFTVIVRDLAEDW